MEGGRIERVELRRPDLRFPFPPGFGEAIEGRTVTRLGRRAKYLLADLDAAAGAEPATLVMHLGMSGAFRVLGGHEGLGGDCHAKAKDPAHDHVAFALGSGTRVVYNDPRRFGFMTIAPTAALDRHPYFAGLGPEPVGEGFDGALLARAFAGRRTSLKAALLDQRTVAGLGNIYACEALWRAGLSPERQAAGIAGAGKRTPRAARALADAVRAVIAEAIEAGGSSLRDHRMTDGSLGRFQHRFAVYGREGEPCPRCGGGIVRIAQNGRSTFFCPRCQD